jgi:hypothetical protein
MMVSMLVVSLQLGQIGSVHAQEAGAPTPAPNEAAERFERGVELYSDGALDAALAEFERAYELTLDYRVLYNIGRVQMERHRYVEAIDALERYLSGPDVAETRRVAVQGDIEKMRGRIGQLWVDSDVQGAELFVNGAAVGTLPLEAPIPVNPGACEIRLEKPGYKSVRQPLTVAGGDAPRINLPMTAAPQGSLGAASGDGGVTGPSKPHYNYTPFWISAVSAVALGGGAAVMGVLALDKRDQLSKELGDPPSNPTLVESLRDDGKLFAGVTDGLALGAIVAGAVGVYFLVDPPKKKDHTVVSGLRFSASPGQVLVSGQF